MDKDYVDKFIKESLYNHETQIDNDLLWAAIEQKKSANRINAFGILGLLGALLVAGFVLVNFPSKESENNSVLSTERIVNSDNTSAESIKSLVLLNSDESKDVINVTKSKSESFVQGNTAEQSESTSTEERSKNAIITETTNNNLQQANNKTNKTDIADVAHFNTSKIQINSTQENLNDNTFSSQSFTNIQEDKNINQVNSGGFVNSSEITKSKDILDNSDIKFSTHYNENSASSSAKNVNSFSIDKISIVENNLQTNSISRHVKNLNLLESNVSYLNPGKAILPSPQLSDCPTFGSKKRNLYLQVYTIFDYVKPSFTSGSDNMSYKNERERTQSYAPSLRAGIQAKYLFTNGLYIKGGFEYGIVREKYKDRIVDTLTTIEPNQLISFFETSPGDTTFIYGNAPVTTISASNWNVSNSYKTFDIPILIGYQISKGSWTYGLELGVIHNIKMTTKSFILDSSLKPRLAPEYYKNSISQTLTGGVTLGYNLTPDVKILGLLQFKHNLSLINSTVNPIDQKNLHIGLGAGAEYRF